MGNGISIVDEYSDHPPINDLPDELLVIILKFVYDNLNKRNELCPVHSLYSTFPEKQSALRDLRLVCARWNRIVVDFLGLERIMNLYVRCNNGKKRMTAGFTRTGQIPYKTMMKRHLKHVHADVQVAIILGNDKRMILKSEHLSEIAEFMKMIPNIHTLRCGFYVRSCRIKADWSAICKMFASFTRPEHLRRIYFHQNCDQVWLEPFDEFLRKHNNLWEVEAGFVTRYGDYDKQCRQLLETVMQKRVDEGYFVRIEKDWHCFRAVANKFRLQTQYTTTQLITEIHKDRIVPPISSD